VTVVVLLGAPGAGKGTQAPILAERLAVPHIATGDLFRAAVRDGTPVGKEAAGYMDRGELVPDVITIRMLLERLRLPDADHGAILDGFPRNRRQAEALDEALGERSRKVALAIVIEVPAEDLVKRMSGRWICRASGHVYNVTSRPPRVPGLCDIDDSELYQREDDQVDTVRARLAQQLGALGDVVAYYRERHILDTVDGRASAAAVTEDLIAKVAAGLAKAG
jgi:adenylate kinase